MQGYKVEEKTAIVPPVSKLRKLLELMVLRSVYFMVKFRIFIPELWDFIHQIVGDFSYVAL
jgi:hypothetical protein